MDNFVNVLEKAKKAEIDQLKETLKSKKKTALSQMQSEVSELEKKIEDKSNIQKYLQQQQKKYNQIKTHDFAELEIKEKIARKAFDEIVSKKFKKASFEKKWLEDNVKNINKLDKGVIRSSSKTKNIISKLTKNHKVETDKNIESGFIFENDFVQINATKEKFFENLFNENKVDIYKKLFS